MSAKVYAAALDAEGLTALIATLRSTPFASLDTEGQAALVTTLRFTPFATLDAEGQAALVATLRPTPFATLNAEGQAALIATLRVIPFSTLNAEELTVLIASLRSTPFAILERLDKIDFPGPSETIAPADWPVGRIFGEAVELHWEYEGTTYQARLTFADGTLLSDKFREVLSLDRPEPISVWYYLWGEDEIAIGGRLDYSRAIPGLGRGQLGIIEYRDESGRLVFYRYAGLRREVERGR